MKRTIRLTEQDLHNIVKESVNRILEYNEAPDLNDYLCSVENFKNQLRKMIPYLPFYSPEERAEIEADMARLGINPRDPEEFKKVRR